MKKLSHLNASGEAHMVDISQKPPCTRTATATALLVCQPETITLLRTHALPKGDALTVARVAGIQAAKRTDEWIPLCHTLPIEQISVDFEIGDHSIRIHATATVTAKTGVEMEALVAVSAAALALYDMLKSADKTMSVQDIRVTSKTKS